MLDVMLVGDAAAGISLLSALLAAALGVRFLLAAQRLGGEAVLRLVGVGFLALALAAALVAPSLPEVFDLADAVRVVLMVLAFSAVGLGYLLQARHRAEPHPGWDFAYQAFLLATAVALAPFALLAVLHPFLQAFDEGAHTFTAVLAAAVAWRLFAAPTPSPHRSWVTAGFALLALQQAFLVVEDADLGLAQVRLPLVLAAEAALLLGLACFAATVLRDRREAEPQ